MKFREAPFPWFSPLFIHNKKKRNLCYLDWNEFIHFPLYSLWWLTDELLMCPSSQSLIMSTRLCWMTEDVKEVVNSKSKHLQSLAFEDTISSQTRTIFTSCFSPLFFECLLVLCNELNGGHFHISSLLDCYASWHDLVDRNHFGFTILQHR